MFDRTVQRRLSYGRATGHGDVWICTALRFVEGGEEQFLGEKLDRRGANLVPSRGAGNSGGR
jgi:hypothetical protein